MPLDQPNAFNLAVAAAVSSFSSLAWLCLQFFKQLNIGFRAAGAMERGACAEIRRLQPKLMLWVCMLLLLASSTAGKRMIGINYGRVADNLPPPAQAVALIHHLNISRVKIYDADPQVMAALANSGLEVVVMVKNQELEEVASSQSSAGEWVEKNVVAWHSSVKIVSVVVGNEVLSDRTIQKTWPRLVPAMQNIHSALKRSKLAHVKVTTSLAIDCLEASFPPSNGTFRRDIAEPVITPLLHFLNKTKSPFFVNVYPYFAWASNPHQISLPYTLFGAADSTVVVEDGGLQYRNLLDAQLDALVAAMEKLGFYKVKVGISESGWPSKGDADEAGASTVHAALYNNRLVKWAVGKGTPRRPGTHIPTFIFALFNENLKPGPSTERNWGILYPNGSSVYALDLTGRLKHPPANLDRPSSQKHHTHDHQWCIAKPSADTQAMKSALDYACSKADCVAIQPEQACYSPASLKSHSSYAFNSYYQKYKQDGGTCDFAGTAMLVSTNPSYNNCFYLA